MKKFFILFVTILLFGCQQTTQHSSSIYDEANNIYFVIKNRIEDNAQLTDDDYNQIEKFKKKYVNNYKDYPSDRELISEMESLINSYTLYNVSMGLNNQDGMDMYKNNLNEAIEKLDNQFNN